MSIDDHNIENKINLLQQRGKQIQYQYKKNNHQLSEPNKYTSADLKRMS